MNSLPIPSPAAQQHSQQLQHYIQQDITQHQGWISFSRFMEHALFAPGLGYYTAGASKFGSSGDFITAPELSPLFGQTLANQLIEIMQQSSPRILELGAGSGKLARDILQQLEQQQQLPECYQILEVSADLKQRQQQLIASELPHLFERVQWLDRLPDQINGAVIANEVLDALPVHLIHQTASGPMERGVCLHQGQFAWQDAPISDPILLQSVTQLNLAEDYLSEINLAARGLIHSLAQRLQQGVMIWIDYGFGAREYYHPQRNRGTLMCHYRHFAHDNPFFWPGLQDITAHVNFTDIAESAIDAGLKLKGYTNQAFFLINNGITQLVNQVSPEQVRAYAPLSGQLQKLTSPAEMGELFKVIALAKNYPAPLSGFKIGDLSRTLA